MRRRSRAGSKPAKARSHRAKTLKAARHSGSSVARQKTEVARLTRELRESLEQHRATSEILGIVAGSRTDAQSVLDAICQSAVQLCEAYDASIWCPDGDRLLLAAHHHGPITQIEYVPLVRESVLVRSILDKRTVHVADLQTQVDEFPFTSEQARRLGFRTGLYVPLMREGVAIGVIALRRVEAQLFAERQVALLQTFANQAVIAIENGRLLNELRERTTDLTESLEQQTATSEVLGVINRSPGELEPVFQTMLANAVRICEAKFGHIYRWNGDVLSLAATHNTPPAYEALRRAPHPPGSRSPTARVVTAKAIVHVVDMTMEEAYKESDPRIVEAVELAGMRTYLGVPMLKENELIGVLALYRQEVRPFTD